jgi:hypothetical protein
MNLTRVNFRDQGQLETRRFCWAALGVAFVTLAPASPARAGFVFSGSSGTLSASADFTLSGNTLTILLTNTSTTAVAVPTDVLTGLLFNTSAALTPVSATLPAGSAVWFGSIANAGDGWGYATTPTIQSLDGFNSAISATGAFNGLGHSNFSGAHNALQGLDYGIVNAGYGGSGNKGVTKHGPLIENSVRFTLTVPSGFSLSQLGSSVNFQYGTSANEKDFTGVDPAPVPEPSTLTLLGFGAVTLAAYTRRRRKFPAKEAA